MSLILVTGANGFIGSCISEQLIHSGHQVRGLVRKTSDLKYLEGVDVELFYGDVTDGGTLDAPMEGVDLVVHVAGLASDWGPYSLFYDINVNGVKNMAKAAASAGVKRFVHISTTALHGFKNKEMVDESFAPAKTIFPYCETKKEGERWLLEYADLVDMQIVVIRPGNVFGPKDHTFMDKYLDAIEKGKMAYIDKGNHKTCPTYIENLTDGILLACFEPQAAGEIFILTDGLDINWRTFTNAFADALNKKRPKLSVPFFAGYALAFLMEMVYKLFRISTPPLLTRYRISNGGSDYYFSIEKAKKILNYQPRISFDEAVKRTVEWYKTLC